MTMAMKQGASLTSAKVDSQPVRSFIQEKLFEQKTRGSDLLRVIVFLEVRVFVAQGEEARGFDPNNRCTVFDPRFQFSDVPRRMLFCLQEHSFRNEWTTTAFLVHQLDTVTGCFQEFDSRPADMRCVVSRECVVEENHSASRSFPWRFPQFEPVDESLARKRRELTTSVDPEEILHQPPGDCRPGDQVCHRRKAATYL